MKRPAFAVCAALAGLLAAAPLAAKRAKVPPPAGLRDEAAGHLRDYVRLNTTNPPGNELAAAQFLKGLLDREGIPSEIYVSTPGRANLVARLRAEKPAGPPLLLLHHMDVVAADPSDWEVPPFSGQTKDGSLWGRGALDTKLTGVLDLMTIFQLRRRGVRLNRDVIFLAVADEEVGGRWGTQWMVENHWDDLKPGYVIDEGGFGFVGVLTRDPVPVYACAVDEKHVFWLRVTAEGKSGHGSLPDSDNPNDILRRALARIEQVFIQTRGKPPELLRELDRKVPHLRKTPLIEAMRHNTVSVTSMLSWSGDLEHPKINVVPARAVATVDCRLMPDEDDVKMLQKLTEAVDDDRVKLELVVRTVNHGPYLDYKTPLYAALERAVSDNDPKAVTVPFLQPGATDSRFFRAKGVVCYGIAPLVLNDDEYMLLHAANERVPLDRLETALRIMYDWVKIFCEDKDGADRQGR